MVPEAYECTALLGSKNCGKTTYVMGDPVIEVPSMALTHMQKHNMKCIIVDTVLNRNHYEKVPVLNWRNITALKSGAARTIIMPEERNEFVNLVRKQVRDTLIIFEDSKNIVPQNMMGTPFESLMIDCKNIRCGLLFMYHAFKAMPPGMFMYLDKLVIFKTQSHPSSRKREIMNYEEVLATYNKVTASKNPHFHLTVEMGS